MSLCPCQSNQMYTQCCRPFHDGKAAPTAEALMRSRYSAYVMQIGVYLHRTWHPNTRPSKKSLMQNDAIKWCGLSILRTEAGLQDDVTGVVEFNANYEHAGTLQTLHETSRFCREGGRWYYLDGDYAA